VRRSMHEDGVLNDVCVVCCFRLLFSTQRARGIPHLTAGRLAWMQIPFLGFVPRPILDPTSSRLLEELPAPGRQWEHTWHAVTRPPGRHVNDWFKIVPAHKPSLARAQTAPEGARRIPPARRSGVDLDDWHTPVRANP